MSVTYLPVVTFGTSDKFKYWLDTCDISYNNLLVSPFTTGWDKNRTHFSKQNMIYADSGGFQAITMHKKLSSLDVLRWQERIANIGFTLDVPPHFFSKNYSEQEFQKCMYQSNKNADLMWRFRANEDMQLWGVVQGRNYNECKLWYEDLTNDHEFDGYCIALSIHKSNSELPWIEQLRFAKTVPKRFHFLGYSENLFTLVLAKLSQLTKIDYTYDSSTQNIGGRWGKYIHPQTYKNLPLKDMKELNCSCNFCKNHSIDELRIETQYVNLHNLFTKIEFCKFANSLTDEEFFSYIKELVNENQLSQISGLWENKSLSIGTN